MAFLMAVFDGRCTSSLAELFQTHDICPLPAYDTKGHLIPPLQYDTLLKGATVEVHFAFIHHYIKKHKRHVYNTAVRRINVLQKPVPLPTSPFKHVKVSAQDSGKGKGKQCVKF